ncbi:hypothetical protein scyTo_0014004 [Scyliorhinus torazame]|uniref:Uncharacterized protein n=1 Tax=Scyliorhinus torazame TaxID=75743 RepID=A0A401NFL6_SCYTO|nr:hypothetical protein [Scyliorhinus torazame]
MPGYRRHCRRARELTCTDRGQVPKGRAMTAGQVVHASDLSVKLWDCVGLECVSQCVCVSQCLCVSVRVSVCEECVCECVCQCVCQCVCV